MSIQEPEDEALKFPEDERSKRVERLLANLGGGPLPEDDPILGLGTAPDRTGARNGAAQHDRYIQS